MSSSARNVSCTLPKEILFSSASVYEDFTTARRSVLRLTRICGLPFFGDRVAEEEPVEGRIVGREDGLKIVDNLADDVRQFERGEADIAARRGRTLSLQLPEKLANLFDARIHCREFYASQVRDGQHSPAKSFPVGCR